MMELEEPFRYITVCGENISVYLYHKSTYQCLPILGKAFVKILELNGRHLGQDREGY